MCDHEPWKNEQFVETLMKAALMDDVLLKRFIADGGHVHVEIRWRGHTLLCDATTEGLNTVYTEPTWQR